MNIRATVGGAWVTTSCEGVWWKGASGTDAARSATEHGCELALYPWRQSDKQLMLSMRRLVASIFMHPRTSGHTFSVLSDLSPCPD
jgi:hypothetical protein